MKLERMVIMQNFKKNQIILVVSAVIIALLIAFALLRDTSTTTTLEHVKTLIDTKQIERVVQNDGYLYLQTQKGLYKIAYSQVPSQLLKNYIIEIDHDNTALFNIFALLTLLAAFSYALRYFMKRFEGESGDISAIGGGASPQTQGEGVVPVESDVTFSDIGGISDVKEELQEIIEFLRNPSRFKTFGARMPRGVLLVGPPGVGKTMIAKAVAAEAGVPFYYQSAASFVQIYVGMGAKRVHELFAAAKNNSPSIVFIDEIDAVGKERDGNRSDEREATLNQLLTEMDGFEDSSGVIVIAATNKIDVLDAALLRAGRFDRRVFVELPTPFERKAIINKYLDKVPHDVDVEEIVSMSVGFNGASLAALVNEAALLALRKQQMQVVTEDFYAVKDKVAYGKKKLELLSPIQKQFKARYLAGKAVIAVIHNITFEKVMLSSETIKPSLDAPMTQGEIEAHIKLLLAGMSSCNITFNEHGSNVKKDLTQAKALSKKMLQEYGMGNSILSSIEEESELLERLLKATQEELKPHMEALAAIEGVLMEREAINCEYVKELM